MSKKPKKRAKRSPPLSKWTFVPRHAKSSAQAWEEWDIFKDSWQTVPYLYLRTDRGEYQAAVADNFDYHPLDIVDVRWVGFDGNVDFFAARIDTKDVPAAVGLHMSGRKQPSYLRTMWGQLGGADPYTAALANPSARKHLQYARQLIKEARARKADAMRVTVIAAGFDRESRPSPFTFGTSERSVEAGDEGPAEGTDEMEIPGFVQG